MAIVMQARARSGDTIDVSRPADATRTGKAVSALGDLSLGVLLALLFPLVLMAFLAPLAALAWVVAAVARLF